MQVLFYWSEKGDLNSRQPTYGLLPQVADLTALCANGREFKIIK